MFAGHIAPAGPCGPSGPDTGDKLTHAAVAATRNIIYYIITYIKITWLDSLTTYTIPASGGGGERSAWWAGAGQLASPATYTQSAGTPTVTNIVYHIQLLYYKEG